MFRKTVLVSLAAGLSLSACTTYDSYQDRQLRRAATGAAIGAGVGAAGAAVVGEDVAAGAAIGAVAGGAIGAATTNREWYRDGRGYCYYVNDRNERIYDYNRRC